MVLNSILVAIGGCLGALTRYILSKQITKRVFSNFPAATFLINITGSLLLGLIFGIHARSSISLLFGTGFMGAYTTFSTFNIENIQLALKKNWGTMGLYLGSSYVTGILLAFLGYVMGLKFAG